MGTSVSARPPDGWEFLAPEPGRGEGTWSLGPCWFFCGHQVTAVVWLGCVTTVGANAPLYACEPCLGLLHAMVWDFTEASWDAPMDEVGRLLPLYPPLAADVPSVPIRYRSRDRPFRTPFGARLSRLITEPRDEVDDGVASTAVGGALGATAAQTGRSNLTDMSADDGRTPERSSPRQR